MSRRARIADREYEKITLSFSYDPAEQVTNDDCLTPLYFNKQVLVRYMYDARFRCEFYSETYGSVQGDELQLPFGINGSGFVLVWSAI